MSSPPAISISNGIRLLERYAEPLTAIAALHGCKDKPALLDEAWRCMMINSARDSIHGSGTDEVHVEMQARYMKTHQIAAGVIHDAMAHLGRKTTRFWSPENRGLLTYAPVVSGRRRYPLRCRRDRQTTT